MYAYFHKAENQIMFYLVKKNQISFPFSSRYGQGIVNDKDFQRIYATIQDPNFGHLRSNGTEGKSSEVPDQMVVCLINKKGGFSDFYVN